MRQEAACRNPVIGTTNSVQIALMLCEDWVTTTTNARTYYNGTLLGRLEKALLCFLEVDDIPDGLQVL